MKARALRHGLTMLIGSLVFASLLPGQDPVPSNAVMVAPAKLPDQEERFVLRSVVRSEGKWLASLEDRKTGHGIAWLEKNQLVSGYSLKDISEKAVVLVEQGTGKAVTLHLRPSAVMKSTNGAVPVIERSGASEAGGLIKASSVLDKAQADAAGNRLAPRLAPPLKEGLKAGGLPPSSNEPAANAGTTPKIITTERR